MPRKLIAIVTATTMMALVPSGQVSAASASNGRAAPAASDATSEPSAQSRVAQRRPRARITVRPSGTGIYPSPLPYAYPGPNAVRDCTSWLEQEYRPSGTVIVPRMRCWWILPH